MNLNPARIYSKKQIMFGLAGGIEKGVRGVEIMVRHALHLKRTRQILPPQKEKRGVSGRDPEWDRYFLANSDEQDGTRREYLTG